MHLQSSNSKTSSDHSVRSIAVFRISALGDCILVSGAILALQKAFPNARIVWIIEKGLMPLFSHLEGIELLGIEKPRKLKDYWHLKKIFSSYQFDVLLAMQSSLRANLVYPLIPAKRKIGFDSQRGREGHALFVNEQIPFREEHLMEGFLSFIKHLNPEAELKPIWEFAIAESAKSWVDTQLGASRKNILVLNPAASKLERCCSAEFYLALLKRLQPRFSMVVLTGGANDWELDLAHSIQSQAFLEIPLKNLVGKTNLQQLAAVINEATLFIAPDTGPIHLADALGKKVVGLYAVARPQLTGPYQNLEFVADSYPTVVKKLQGRDINEVAWSHRVHDTRAMTFFDIDELERLVIKALS